MDKIPTPEWVMLIPADSIPVFCFNENTTDRDMAVIQSELQRFFEGRKFMAIRGDVRISAIEDTHDG